MNRFQKIVLISAIIILLIALIFIGFALSFSQDDKWPPLVPQCPDYWQIDGSGNNTTCSNVMNLGNSCTSPMNFNNAPFTGSNGACAKYTWANSCGVTWDGITYGVNNPCQTTSQPSSQ
jgi:hypothetical protein